MTVLNPSSLTAQLKATLPKIKGDRPLAFRCPRGWSGPPKLDVSGRLMQIRHCRSDLEVREAMAEVAADSLVVLVEDDNRLAPDTVARFAKGKLRDPDPRESLLSLVDAQAIAPLLLLHREVLHCLVETWQPEARLASPAGNIECGRAFAWLLQRPNLAAEAPDMVELLRWSLEDGMEAVQQAPDAVRRAFFEWLRERNGPLAGPLHAALDSCGHRLVSLGLVLDVVIPAAGNTAAAQVRLERYLGDEELAPSAAKAWHLAASEVMTKLDEGRQRSLMKDADAWLDELRATELAQSCVWSTAGFDSLIDSLAAALQTARRSDSAKSWDAVISAMTKLKRHSMSRLERPRMETITMALRLTCWLRQPAGETTDSRLGILAEHFLKEDAWVDWARQRLRRGDIRDSLNRSFAAILTKADERRATSNARFAEALRQWTASGEPEHGILPIEDTIDKVLVPLAAESKILLLVLDGMSGAVFAELTCDLQNRGWHALRSTEHALPRPVIAALPSITEVSRAALFRGRLDSADRTTEAVNFREHPALNRQTLSRPKPLLFLKPDLADAGGAGLSSKVRDAIQQSDRRVVAVVINAVDDQLSTLGQLDLQWNAHQITWLKDLMNAASTGNRTIVLMSDHGHVPGCESNISTQLKEADGDRHRLPIGNLHRGEMVFSGPRISNATDRKEWALCVDEGLRYGGRKSGYHGGASDQEAVVPLAILTTDPEGVAGFERIEIQPPAWWQPEPQTAPAPLTPPAVPVRRKKQPVAPAPLELWVASGETDAPPQQSAPQRGASQTTVTATWILELLKSDVLRQQRTLAQRTPISDDVITRTLSLLDARGGVLPLGLLMTELTLPRFRASGLVSQLQRLLNVEGYTVLETDASDHVRLNRDLLLKQFDIKA